MSHPICRSGITWSINENGKRVRGTQERRGRTRERACCHKEFMDRAGEPGSSGMAIVRVLKEKESPKPGPLNKYHGEDPGD